MRVMIALFALALLSPAFASEVHEIAPGVELVAVNGNGTVGAGYAATARGPHQPVIWRESSGVTPIDYPLDWDGTEVIAISRDGSTVFFQGWKAYGHYLVALRAASWRQISLYPALDWSFTTPTDDGSEIGVNLDFWPPIYDWRYRFDLKGSIWNLERGLVETKLPEDYQLTNIGALSGNGRQVFGEWFKKFNLFGSRMFRWDRRQYFPSPQNLLIFGASTTGEQFLARDFNSSVAVSVFDGHSLAPIMGLPFDGYDTAFINGAGNAAGGSFQSYGHRYAWIWTSGATRGKQFNEYLVGQNQSLNWGWTYDSLLSISDDLSTCVGRGTHDGVPINFKVTGLHP